MNYTSPAHKWHHVMSSWPPRHRRYKCQNAAHFEASSLGQSCLEFLQCYNLYHRRFWWCLVPALQTFFLECEGPATVVMKIECFLFARSITRGESVWQNLCFLLGGLLDFGNNRLNLASCIFLKLMTAGEISQKLVTHWMVYTLYFFDMHSREL